MDITKICKGYCIGCGLCNSENMAEMKANEKGYLKPTFNNDDGVEAFLKKVCPINDTSEEFEYNVWGASKGVYEAYATDVTIRKKASSGGVITGVAIYLLEKGYVDGIIHVSENKKNPTETVCSISTTREEIVEGCGSRYAISSPWIKLSEMVDPEKKYAAIGKPCDIKALRKIKENEGKYANILYLLSFFCAGMPSKQANENLLKQLGCERKTCKSLTYRGNGWPGYATAIDVNGQEYTMEYSKAWGGILGRDIHPFCRMCFDGIGEAADIACGDGWYISENQMPDFTERDGRNIVFVRTDVGAEVYREALKDEVLVSAEWEDLKQLEIIQKYQFTRRTTMKDRLLAYRLLGRKVPQYNRKKIKELSRQIAKKERIRVFIGTAKRIVLKKI